MARLVTVQQVYNVGDTLIIGRGQECDLVLDNPVVSRMHAKVSRVKDHYIIEDLESGNGTWVNGNRIESSELKNGDTIKIGDFLFRFESDSFIQKLNE